jgi:acetyltransferase-like isoleucine patch superfamily enzyme
VPDYARWQRITSNEFQVDLRKLGAHAISRAFPRHGFGRTRTTLLRLLGYRIGKSLVAGPLTITGSRDIPTLLSFGDDCYISGPLHIDLMGAVRIGSNVVIGYDVRLITVDHEIGDSNRRCGREWSAPIEIEDGVWIGSGVIVLPGVRIGKGAVIGSGAVVTKDVAANTLVAGVPARVVRALSEEAPPPGARRVRSESLRTTASNISQDR